MKKLFAFLILFSVNSFADNYCFISDEDSLEYEEEIESRCHKGDILNAMMSNSSLTTNLLANLSLKYCAFDKEILFIPDEFETYLQCVLADIKPRTPRQK
tara:strand:- start:306 stop:605 length:300 start_codon:yes stop_codon:yes gene_type:complete